MAGFNLPYGARGGGERGANAGILFRNVDFEGLNLPFRWRGDPGRGRVQVIH